MYSSVCTGNGLQKQGGIAGSGAAAGFTTSVGTNAGTAPSPAPPASHVTAPPLQIQART
jgi:hypothetical protein